MVPQAMPAGLLVTVPVPVPALRDVEVDRGSVNVAVTVRGALSETVQVAEVPVQAPSSP